MILGKICFCNFRNFFNSRIFLFLEIFVILDFFVNLEFFLLLEIFVILEIIVILEKDRSTDRRMDIQTYRQDLPIKASCRSLKYRMIISRQGMGLRLVDTMLSTVSNTDTVHLQLILSKLNLFISQTYVYKIYLKWNWSKAVSTDLFCFQIFNARGSFNFR